VGGADAAIAFSSEGYRRLDGDDPPYYGGYEDDVPGEGDAFADVAAAYELNQGVQGDENSFYYVVRLLQFADAEQAGAYLARLRDEGLSPAGTPVEEIAAAQALGDKSWTINYGAESEPGYPVEGIAVHARVGATTLMLLPEGDARPNLAVVETLAAGQAVCLAGETCPPWVSLGAALLAATPAL
jgi:hypothetical protein